MGMGQQKKENTKLPDEYDTQTEQLGLNNDQKSYEKEYVLTEN